MNISLERIDGAAAGKLMVSIQKDDYQNKVAARLKKMKQQAQMPGFRKGMVPMSLIQKMYGTQAKADELQSVLAEAVNNYIGDEKLHVMGEPMLAEDNEPADVENKDDFLFKFDLAFSPEISIKLDGRTSLDYYNIEVSDEAIERQISAYRRQGGKHTSAEVFADEDLIKGSLKENKEGEDALSLEQVSLMPRFFSNDEQKALFNAAQKGADIVFNPSKAYEGREAELTSFLKIDKQEADKHQGEFTLHIDEIDHFEMAEVNEDLMKMVYPVDTPKSEEEFKARVSSEIADQYKQDSNYKFMLDLKDYALKKVGDIPLAEDLLKKMVLQNAKSEESRKQIDEQFDSYLNDLRWSLVRNVLSESLEVKIGDDDLLETSKRMIKMQMAQYGLMNMADEYVEQFAKERMQNEGHRNTVMSAAIDDAIVKAALGVVKLKEHSVSIEDFNKMFEESYKTED